MAMAKLTQFMKDTLIEIAEYHSDNPARKFSATRFNKSSLKAICKRGYIKFDEQELYFTVSQKGVDYLKEIFPDLSFDNPVTSNITRVVADTSKNHYLLYHKYGWLVDVVKLGSIEYSMVQDEIHHWEASKVISQFEFEYVRPELNHIVDMNNIAKLFAAIYASS